MSMDEEVQPPLDINYGWDEMPSGPFVGEVCRLTHEVAKALDVEFERGCDKANKRFIAAETTIRNYVWMAAQRAWQAATAQQNEDVRALVEVAEKFCAWNVKYPSSRIYNEQRIRTIAAELDLIYAETSKALLPLTAKNDEPPECKWCGKAFYTGGTACLTCEPQEK